MKFQPIQRTGNILEQQVLNRRLTIFLVGVFIFYFLIFGYLTDVFLFDNDLFELIQPNAEGFPMATFSSIILAAAYSIFSFYRADDLILRSMYAERIWHDDLTNRQLVNVVQEMAIAAGIPPPAIYIIHDRDPNALAMGRDPSNATVAVTSGLLEKFNREQLQAVIAHEIGHIRNYDTRLMMMIAALAGGSFLLASYSRARWLSRGGKVKLTGGTILLFYIWIGMVILTPIITRLFTVAITRQREYQADVTAAELTRNPEGVLSALERLDVFGGPTRRINRGLGHMCVMDPIGKFMQMENDPMFYRLFKTHPPMDKRISAMRAMGFLQIPRKNDSAGENSFGIE